MAFSNKGMWDDRLMGELRALADTQLYSASQMAKMLSARFGIPITRNALIGKCSRNKIALRGSKKMPMEDWRKALRPAPQRAKSYPKAKAAPKPIKVAIPEPRPIGDMPGGCKWMHGDALDRLFCGAPATHGSWCAHHAKRVWAPQPRGEFKPALKSRFAA